MRLSPYGTGMTFEEWEAAQAVRGRPLTNDPIRARHAFTDARHSRLVEPQPRNRTGAQRSAEYRTRKHTKDAA